MENKHINQLPLGRIFSVLTKKYLGLLSHELKDSPIERYYFPLYLIGVNSGKISQQQLADFVITDKVSIVRIVDSLEREQLIVRKKNKNDRRQHDLWITEKAAPWIKKIEIAMQKTDQIFLHQLQTISQNQFKPALVHLVKSVLDLPADEIEVFYSKKKKKT
jgi:MarR family transcriptional regulator for hemolysin